MKRKKIIIGILIGVIVAGTGTLISCTRKGTPHESEKGGESGIDYYTCPMHPFIHEKKKGECPICHMKLVPVYKGGTAPKEGSDGGPSVNISTERQQLIDVKTGTVEKKQVTKEIRTVGRVAFDPDLAIAQREFVEISKSVPSLKDASFQRLRLLGMSEDDIRHLAKTGKPQGNLYLPQEGEAVWVYAPIYEYEIPLVKIGDRVDVTLPSFSDTFEGTIRGIDPVVDPMTRSVRARIEVPKAGGKVKPETYLNVTLKIDLGEQLTVPKSAVIDTGTRRIVFLVHDGKNFEAREVKLGTDAGDDRIIQKGLSEGDVVATSAAFLIDSESQLKAAVSGMGGMGSTPACPEGQAWDTSMNMCMPKTGG